MKMEINKESEKPASESDLLQWSQWQLLDSILPTGGFAHSFGLEAAIQVGIVTGPEDLQTFIIHALENTASLLLPFVYSATMSPNMENWRRLDRMLNATLTNEVGRKASISQGSALMRVAAAVFSEIHSLKTMREACLGTGTVAFHHAPIFGLVCGLVGLDSRTSQRAYMFITMRDIISAATRLRYVSTGSFRERMIKWNRISYIDASFGTESQYLEVKKCGIRAVYKPDVEELRKRELHFICPPTQDLDVHFFSFDT